LWEESFEELLIDPVLIFLIKKYFL